MKTLQIHDSPDELLAWAEKKSFAAAAQKLARLFIENFNKFEEEVTLEVKAGGPKV
jgi:ATP-dependent phosphoenolpyruvate carboxykinase